VEKKSGRRFNYLMSKSGIHINVPGHGELFLRHMITDYTGTFSYRGVLSESVHEKLRQLGKAGYLRLVGGHSGHGMGTAS
jgi:hypothetical protein